MKNTQNKKRKAFTIVELVIVIAVIAVLAGVLIPTFGGIIESAHQSTDLQTATSLGTVLKTHLMTKTINDKDELALALNESGIADKLVPKAKGYHFWYDFKNQRIVSGTYEDAKSGKLTTINGVASIDVDDRVYLASGDEPQNAAQGATKMPYDIFGFPFLTCIDAGTGAVANLINEIVNFGKNSDVTDHAALVAKVGEILETANNKDKELIQEVATRLQSTTVVTEAAHAESATAENIYFAAGIQSVNVSGKITFTGEVVLPSTIIAVGDGNNGGLHFNGVVTIVTSGENASALEKIFADGSTNATITITSGEMFKIGVEITEDGEKYGREDSTGDKLVSIDQETGEATLVPDITLSSKLKCEDFEINVEANDSTKIKYDASNDTLYVSAYDYVVSGTKIDFSIISNAGEKISGAMPAIEWQLNGVKSDNNLITLPAGTSTATVTAIARNINGERITKTATIVVIGIENAKVSVGNSEYAIGVGTGSIEWSFTGKNNSMNVTLGDYKYINTEFISPVPNIAVTFNSNALKYESGKIVLATDEDGKVMAIGKTVVATITVDGCLSSNVTISVKDNTETPLVHKFNHTSGPNYYYYIGGHGTVTLGDLFKSNGKEVLDSSIDIQIQDADGVWTDFAEIAGFDMTCSGLVNYKDKEWRFSGANWQSVAITEIKGLNNGTHIRLMITPQAVDKQNADVTLELVYVDAYNVTSIADLISNAAANKSVVLFGNHTVANTDKIAIGSGKTLYGNGFKITATSYVSTAATNVLTDAFITLNGGAIDNVYIDGPHYNTLAFNANTNGYYVSGISATGASTIQNSYISGFRQPVMYNGGTATLNVINTTLRGGNYGNLLVRDGNLYMKDVTTVQDQNGIQATVGGTNKVVGMGVVLEKDTIDNTVTLDGNIKHYNWVEKNQTGVLPKIQTFNKELDMKTLFGYIFNGFSGMRIGRFLYYIHQNDSQTLATDTSNTSSVKEYVNAGIVFMDFQESANDTVTAEGSVKIDMVTFANTYSQNARKHSLVTMQASTIDAKLMNAADVLGMDVTVGIWSYTDGREWAYKKPNYGSLAPLMGYKTTNASYDNVVRVTNADLNYPGYNYGN